MEVFSGAERQLENARYSAHLMRSAATAVAFRTAFESFVQHARNVTFALQKDGRSPPVEGFESWYASRQAEMRRDPLCQWFVTARNRIAKEGLDVLAYSMTFLDIPLPVDAAPQGWRGCLVRRTAAHWLVGPNDEPAGLMPTTPRLPWDSAPSGTVEAVLSFEGAHWIVADSSGVIRRETVRGVRFSAVIQAANPPLSHRGIELEDPHNPVALTDLQLAFLEGLVHDANVTFDRGRGTVDVRHR